jgi:hypothetical protein
VKGIKVRNEGTTQTAILQACVEILAKSTASMASASRKAQYLMGLFLGNCTSFLDLICDSNEKEASIKRKRVQSSKQDMHKLLHTSFHPHVFKHSSTFFDLSFDILLL